MEGLRTKKAQREYMEVTNDQPVTIPQKISTKIAGIYGSWGFVLLQTSVFLVWVICNAIEDLPHWDEPPFILLNLILSFIAAYTGTILQMASNRQEASDRKLFEHEYATALHLREELDALRKKQDVILKLLQERNDKHAWD